MPSKSKDIKERHAVEVRVRVKANFSGFCHPFGINVKKGKEYEVSKTVVEKYNKELKTKAGNEPPFKIIGEPKDEKYSLKNSKGTLTSPSSLGSNSELQEEGKKGAMTTKSTKGDSEEEGERVKELKQMRKNELVVIAEELDVDNPDAMNKDEMVAAIVAAESGDEGGE